MYGYNLQKNTNGIISIMDRFRLLDTYSLVKNNIRSQVAIIMYHRIGTNKDIWSIDTTYTSDFEKQMRYLKKTYEIISFEKLTQAILEKKTLPKRAAIVTFDDGYKDNYTEAYPILKKYEIPATIFLTTGYIETDNLFWWDKIGYVLCNTKLKKIELEDFGDISPISIDNIPYSLDIILEKFKKIPEDKKKKLIEILVQKSDVDIPRGVGKNLIMSWDNIGEMNENGINFGAHTVTHPVLTNLSLNQAKFEIIESKKNIEKRLDKTVTTFSYPNGLANDYNSEIVKILKENGFICSVTAIPKMVTSKSDLFELGRLPPGDSYKSFKFCISGLYSDLFKVLGLVIKS
jgi:peptidoglycan/xylan/chitin deacetylase (PgdA/CDA1 family)